jgi:MoaA/NifB/PqqE/SkfB family radical SAM enzyme
MTLFISKALKDLAKNGVLHATLNPEGPGAVRIHLIPSDYTDAKHYTSVVMVNGYWIIPMGTTWTYLLSCFLQLLNENYAETEIKEIQIKELIKNAAKRGRQVFWFFSTRQLMNDIEMIINQFIALAHNEVPPLEMGAMTLKEYAPKMKAPHRMDLLVSSIADEKGNWHCNQKCSFCYAAGQKLASVKELPTEDWKQIITKCREAGIVQLTFTGGEPTLRSDLVELVDHSRWFVTRLNTNGVLLTKELSEKLMKASLDSVQVTVYSFDPEIHNHLVGAKNFEKTIQGLENALAAGLNVSVNTPLCQENKNYVQTVAFLKNKGVTYFSCSGIINTGSAVDNPIKQLNEEELYFSLEEATQYCWQEGCELSFTSPGLIPTEQLSKLNLNTPLCGACLSNMAVTPDGKVIPCQSWLKPDGDLGSMLSTPWKEIFNHPLAVKLRSMDEKTALTCPFRTGEIK